jgi:antitoxin MazE
VQRLTKWGNSTGLRIPVAVLEAVGLKAGSYVYVRTLNSGEIRVRPVTNVQPADDPAEPSASADVPETQW